MPLNPERLAELHPRLYHMAEDGSWPSIRDHGLHSSSRLLDRYGVEGSRRYRLETRRRPASVALEANGLPRAVIRDQLPMTDGALERCLQGGLAPPDWYKTLNGKTFLWATRERVDRLLGARAYRDRPQEIMTIDSRSFLARYADRVQLCAINSGSTLFKPQPRGPGTFKSITQFPYEALAARRGPRGAVVEVIYRRT